MSRKTFFAAFLLTSLVVAGGLSYYASSHPDGLEYVAEQTGFSDAAEESPTAGSPLADYQTEGVDDPRLSGGVAGVVGALATLGLASGVVWLVRRRSARGDAEHPEHERV
ncbi:PDGLE domain-containing protein [Nocardioides marmoraquaticus]